MQLYVVGVVACLLRSSIALPIHAEKMTGIVASGLPCSSPDWTCVSLSHNIDIPVPADGELLMAMKASSVSPLTVELVEPRCKQLAGFLNCSNGTIGPGGSGVVAALGPNCHGFSIGDEVWGIPNGAYAGYTVAKCAATGLKPKQLSFAGAGVSLEGVTSLQCLRRAGAPWQEKNITVAITSGQGGTGVMAIQLAKVYGAEHVVTAATGMGIELVKSLGADLVFDYHKVEMFDALLDDSVDIVFDNLGHPGTADKAMHAIRSGGTYVLLAGGGGVVSKNPKPGVKQLEVLAVDLSNSSYGLDLLAPMFDAGSLKPIISKNYTLAEVPLAFTNFIGGAIGKLSIHID